MKLTYGQLLDKLKTLTPEQLNQDVTFYDANNDEVHALTFCDITGQEEPHDVRPASDVLDDGHFYLGHM